MVRALPTARQSWVLEGAVPRMSKKGPRLLGCFGAIASIRHHLKRGTSTT